MTRRDAASELSLSAVLQAGKEVPRQPDALRARVLDRARATAASLPPELAPNRAPPARFPGRVVAQAAAAALAVGIAGTVFALGGGWLRPTGTPNAVAPITVSKPAPVPPVAAPRSAAAAAPSAEPTPEPAEQALPQKAPARAPRAKVGEASHEAELELMRSAHTAYAAHDYANALVLVGEHGRRFPGGVLAEEREALRVRCLLGSGRTSEARRAAQGFATRFPRSVLVQRLKSEVGAE